MTHSKVRFAFDRVASVAAMQEWMRNSHRNCHDERIRCNFRRRIERAALIACRRTGFSIPQMKLTVSIGLQHTV
jgi:hypothetical protein